MWRCPLGPPEATASRVRDLTRGAFIEGIPDGGCRTVACARATPPNRSRRYRHEYGPEPNRSGPSQPGRLRGLVLLARLELVRVLQVAERAVEHRAGVQRTGEVAVSVAVAVWDEDRCYRGGGAGAAGTR